MKQGVGFSVTINIIAIFLVVIFAFLAAALSYYKAYKINNVISASIEKYDGYNDELSRKEIETKLTSLGYVNGAVSCKNIKENNKEYPNKNDNYKNYSYCVYKIPACDIKNKKNESFKGCERWSNWKVVTFMTFDIPIINQRINIPIHTTTKSIYKF